MSEMIEPGKEPNWWNLISLGGQLINQNDIEAQHCIIVDAVERLLQCQARLWLATEDTGLGEVDISSINTLTPLMKTLLENYLSIENRDTSNLSSKNTIISYVDERSLAAAVLLVAHNDILGVLQAERSDGSSFTEGEVELLEGLASQAAIAIHAARQIAIDRWQVELLNLVRQVSAQIANVLDLDELSRRVTRQILETFKYYYIAIFTTEPGNDVLLFRDSAGPLQPNQFSISQRGYIEDTSPLEDQSPILSVRIGDGMIGYAAQSGMEIIANDVNKESHYRHMDALPETKSEIALPLKVGGQLLGVLDVQSNRINAFGDMDILVLRSLADNIATAIFNTRLYHDLKRRASHLSSVAEISKAITSILRLDDLLSEVVDLIHTRFEYPYVQVFIVNKDQLVYQTGNERHGDTQDILTYDIENTTGPVQLAALKAKTIIINDINNDPRYSPHPSGWLPVRTFSELAVPLIFNDIVLGVLDIHSDRKNAFGDDDLFIIEALADNIAVAIRNANLYLSEQWRRQVADSMREVAGLLSADVGLDQVLDRILVELSQTLPCDVAAIWLLEDAESDSGIGQFISSLRLAAIYTQASQIDIDQKLARGFSLEEITETYKLPPSISPWIDKALNELHPSIRTPQSPYEPLGALLNFPQDYSAIAAPLRIGERTLGLLVLAHHYSGRYGNTSQLMTSAYASYAAVAIENARLYEAARDQAWISTVLLQVAEATQSLTALNELLETVVRILPSLIGVNACAMLLWDENIDAFIPAAAHGFIPDQIEYFQSWHIEPGDVPAFDQIRTRRSPVILDNDTIPNDVATRLFYSIDISQELLVLFPMITQDTVRGAILVDFSYEETEMNQSVDQWDEKFAIIQGIAHQTAIAVENIQLLEAQEEEAYVSVALLQVAQAIVSSNELDEVLEAVVRITPILVGVKRCVIYLWDEQNNAFRFSQEYGISRNELSTMPTTFTPVEYPLLETIRQNNTLVYHRINETTESPLSWRGLTDASYIVVNQALSEDEFSRTDNHLEFLESKSSLLLGFPLAVKGKVLGIMLTQEPDMSSGIPAYRIRQKRLEIVTGITQQAALAIQNDLLQHEFIVRERLERELQLAREIQQTFLPEQLPSLPGWDIDIRWRPARQVGGDFYDVFALPDNRLGLVIADVADKGMPAALFMTLIRTLIRAAVQDAGSPAAVLKQVNDLLVPDAKHGMFVTVVYAVLTLDSGLLEYANAGHNPPLVWRSQNQELEELTKSGMALGVMEGIEIEDRICEIMPGDFVIFYTDGVTEAFSGQGEMFGYDRLQNIVTTEKYNSAQRMLDAIFESINLFTVGIPPSDDLTLAVLLRDKL